MADRPLDADEHHARERAVASWSTRRCSSVGASGRNIEVGDEARCATCSRAGNPATRSRWRAGPRIRAHRGNGHHGPIAVGLQISPWDAPAPRSRCARPSARSASRGGAEAPASDEPSRAAEYPRVSDRDRPRAWRARHPPARPPRDSRAGGRVLPAAALGRHALAVDAHHLRQGGACASPSCPANASSPVDSSGRSSALGLRSWKRAPGDPSRVARRAAESDPSPRPPSRRAEGRGCRARFTAFPEVVKLNQLSGAARAGAPGARHGA